MDTNGHKIETKSVKHTFTPEERDQLGGDLARCVGSIRSIEAEFDQVKAGYKAKTAEAASRVESLSTALVNGFEMRNKRCVVAYRPQERQKDYLLEADVLKMKIAESAVPGFVVELAGVVLTEPMTAEDFQAELIMAESKFDTREEITLFPPTERDRGVLVVGRFAGVWFSALRVNIGKLSLEERLDSEQRSFKKRADAVSHAVKRVKEWLKTNLKDHAKGFETSFDAVVDAHKEREE